MDKTNYLDLTETQLFAHNAMRYESKRMDPYDSSLGTGVIGRMADALILDGHNVGTFSVDTNSVALAGVAGLASSPTTLDIDGARSVY